MISRRCTVDDDGPVHGESIPQGVVLFRRSWQRRDKMAPFRSRMYENDDYRRIITGECRGGRSFADPLTLLQSAFTETTTQRRRHEVIASCIPSRPSDNAPAAASAARVDAARRHLERMSKYELDACAAECFRADCRQRMRTRHQVSRSDRVAPRS